MKAIIRAYSGEDCTGELLSEETIEVNPLYPDDIEKPAGATSFNVEFEKLDEDDFDTIRAWLADQEPGAD